MTPSPRSRDLPSTMPASLPRSFISTAARRRAATLRRCVQLVALAEPARLSSPLYRESGAGTSAKSHPRQQPQDRPQKGGRPRPRVREELNSVRHVWSIEHRAPIQVLELTRALEDRLAGLSNAATLLSSSADFRSHFSANTSAAIAGAVDPRAQLSDTCRFHVGPKDFLRRRWARHS